MENEEQEWIEAPEGWAGLEQPESKGKVEEDDNSSSSDGEGGMLDLFGAEDPQQSFTYSIKLNDNTTKRIQLKGFKLDTDEVDHSTGVTLWQAAPRLADYIQAHPAVCIGKSVLELGAGLGLVGMTAVLVGGKDVLITDGDTHALQKLRENVQQNCGEDINTIDAIRCKQLLWGSPYMEQFLDQHGRFDTILGADIIYTQAAIQPLFDTVACLLKKERKGQFVLSRHNKWNGVEDETVIAAAEERGMECTKTPEEGIFLFHLT